MVVLYAAIFFLFKRAKQEGFERPAYRPDAQILWAAFIADFWKVSGLSVSVADGRTLCGTQIERHFCGGHGGIFTVDGSR